MLAVFSVTPQRSSPRTVTVPPGIDVTLVVRSGDGNPHELVLLGVGAPVVVEVPASGRVRRSLGRLRAGRGALRIDDTEIGHLRVADVAGP